MTILFFRRSPKRYIIILYNYGQTFLLCLIFEYILLISEKATLPLDK